ncbi:MAG: SgcJ/EcaC family oxidoreductase [Parvularculaceae bacterium]
MRLEIACAALALVPGVAAAASPVQSCRRGADERTIEIILPGKIGAACDVVYTRDGGANVTTPYHADNQEEFCAARANELAALLAADGFECDGLKVEMSASTDAMNNVTPDDEIGDESLNSQLAALQGDQGKEDDRSQGSALADNVSSIIADEAIDDLTPNSSDVASALDPATSDPKEPQEQVQPILEIPKPAEIKSQDANARADVENLDGSLPQAAQADPVNLTASSAPSDYKAPKPVRVPTSTRIVGVKPDIDDILEDTPSANADPERALVNGGIDRSPEDTVAAVLRASAAAWNEGNLEAYIAFYAPGQQTTLIDGADVMAGESQIRKRYERWVSDAGSMGRLNYSNLRVTLTAENVATVIGRYAVKAGERADKGLMTLVLRQSDGKWRIIQDTRVEDSATLQ